jgi:Skp family chaperone for outer membrane proteins
MSTKITRSAGQANANAGNDGHDAGTLAVLKRFDAMEKKYDDKMDDLKKTLDSQLEKFRTDLKADLRAEFQPLIRANEDQTKANTSKIEVMEFKCRQLEDRLEMNEKAADLIVRGVPVFAKEVVENHYKTIARVLGYDADGIPRADVFRLGRKLPNAKQDPPILIKFTTKLDKSEFFRKYLTKMGDMKLTILGFSAPSRFYIGENLTKQTQAVYSEALNLKKAGKIDGVTSSFGCVYVKPKNSQRSVPIRNMLGLVEFQIDE